MITNAMALLDLMREHHLRLCHEPERWVLIGSNGRPHPSVSAVSPEIAEWVIAQGFVVDLFEGKRGKYENAIYHLEDAVLPEVKEYIEFRFGRRDR